MARGGGAHTDIHEIASSRPLKVSGKAADGAYVTRPLHIDANVPAPWAEIWGLLVLDQVGSRSQTIQQTTELFAKAQAALPEGVQVPRSWPIQHRDDKWWCLFDSAHELHTAARLAHEQSFRLAAVIGCSRNPYEHHAQLSDKTSFDTLPVQHVSNHLRDLSCQAESHLKVRKRSPQRHLVEGSPLIGRALHDRLPLDELTRIWDAELPGLIQRAQSRRPKSV